MGKAAGKLPQSACRPTTLAQSNNLRPISRGNDIADIEILKSGQVAFRV
jgi:hypothetical protein